MPLSSAGTHLQTLVRLSANGGGVALRSGRQDRSRDVVCRRSAPTGYPLGACHSQNLLFFLNGCKSQKLEALMPADG